MSIQMSERKLKNFLVIRVSGRLAREDYRDFVPELERILREKGRIRVLLELVDFHGWKPGALLEDLKFDLSHFSHLDRLAIVGDRVWEKVLSLVSTPFTTAEIRYFER